MGLSFQIPHFESVNSFFPLRESLYLNNQQIQHEFVSSYLEKYLTAERQKKIDQVIQERTYHVVPVLDHIYDEGNISAVWRSADNFGLQSVHMIRSQRTKKIRTISRGSEKWLDLYFWDDTKSCLKKLKSLGYKIVATVLHPQARPIETLDVSSPLCLVFGNEKDGVNQDAMELADEWCHIPTHGFSQSLNISVAAGTFFHHVRHLREQRLGCHGDLNPTQKEILRAHYYMKSVHTSHQLLEHYLDSPHYQQIEVAGKENYIPML